MRGLQGEKVIPAVKHFVGNNQEFERHRIDEKKALRPGENALEIRVTNLWVNRLIGDQQPDAAEKYTYTTQAFYQADSPLLPSGLLGPVQLVSVSTP